MQVKPALKPGRVMASEPGNAVAYRSGTSGQAAFVASLPRAAERSAFHFQRSEIESRPLHGHDEPPRIFLGFAAGSARYRKAAARRVAPLRVHCPHHGCPARGSRARGETGSWCERRRSIRPPPIKASAAPATVSEARWAMRHCRKRREGGPLDVHSQRVISTRQRVPIIRKPGDRPAAGAFAPWLQALRWATDGHGPSRSARVHLPFLAWFLRVCK